MQGLYTSIFEIFETTLTTDNESEISVNNTGMESHVCTTDALF